MVSLTHLIISTLKKQFVNFSCQNWDSLLGIGLGLVSAIYGVRGYESNLDLAAYHDRTLICAKKI